MEAPPNEYSVTMPVQQLVNALLTAVTLAGEGAELRARVTQLTQERDAIYAQLASAVAPGVTPAEPPAPVNFIRHRDAKATPS